MRIVIKSIVANQEKKSDYTAAEGDEKSKVIIDEIKDLEGTRSKYKHRKREKSKVLYDDQRRRLLFIRCITWRKYRFLGIPMAMGGAVMGGKCGGDSCLLRLSIWNSPPGYARRKEINKAIENFKK